MTGKHKRYVYGGLIILGGIAFIVWMRSFLVSKGVVSATPVGNDPLNVGTLKLQTWFTTALNAQPGTTAFPSQLS